MINGIPNDQIRPNVATDSDGMKKITVANRARHQVFAEVIALPLILTITLAVVS